MMLRFILILLLAPMVVAEPMDFSRKPSLFLDKSEINLIRTRLSLSPWSDAFDGLRDRANNGLKHRVNPVYGEYRTSKRTRKNYRNVFKDSNMAADLALMYQFSEEPRYGLKAREILLAWVQTMKPIINSYQSGIELSISAISFLSAADLLWNSGILSVQDKAKIKNWSNRLGYSARAAKEFCCGSTHNIHNWEWALQISAGVVSEDKVLFNDAVEKFKNIIPFRFEPNFLLKSEGTRTMEYAWYALRALTVLAEVARHQGIDLYNYEQNGYSLYKVAKAHTKWFLDREYPGAGVDYQRTKKYGLDLAEIWFSVWREDIFKRAIDEKERPARDVYVFGPVTLTHGERDISRYFR